MSRRLWLAVALVCSLVACPVSAYADDGFVGGVQDFFGTREVDEVADTRDDEYVPVLRDVETVEVVDMSTQDAIQLVGNSFNSVPVDSSKFSMLEFAGWSIGKYAGSGRIVLLAAVGLVFMWWGVRKALRMLMASFRKGSASV